MCFDDKRFVLDDGIHTFAYFHKYCKCAKKCAKRFSQMTLNKKRFSQIRRVPIGSHKNEEILTGDHK